MNSLKFVARSLNSAYFAAVLAAVCICHAQTYQIGPENSSQKSKAAQKQPNQAQQPNLGFGTNIENARLGRSAEPALQRGDKVHALE